MAIDVQCGSCGKAYKVPDNIAGRKIRCKACETVIQVPDAAPLDEIDPWDIEEEFGGEPLQAAPRRRRASSAADYDDHSSGGGLSGTQIVLLCVGAGFLILLLACGGVAYMVITKAQQMVAEMEEGFEEIQEEIIEEARLTREQRAKEMAEATLAPLDLSKIGLPMLMDLPEGTTVERDSDIGPQSQESLYAYLEYGSLINWTLMERDNIKTIEDLKREVKNSYEVREKDIEVVGDTILIFKVSEPNEYSGNAIYDFQALITDGERRIVISENMGELFSREVVDFFANCVQTTRPKEGATEPAETDAAARDDAVPVGAAATDDAAATGDAAEQ